MFRKCVAVFAMAALMTLHTATAQRTVFFGTNRRIVPATCTKSDSFSGSGALSSCWTQTTASGYGTLNRASGNIVVATGTKGIVVYTGAIYSTTQTSTVTVPVVPTGSTATGPAILMNSAGSGYIWLTTLNAVYRIDAGVGIGSIGAQCPVPHTNDQLRLSASVSGGVPTITCTDLTTPGGGPGGGTDGNASPHITGNPGVFVEASDVLTGFIST